MWRVIDLLAWKACDHRRFASVKAKEGNLVANVRQCTMLRERQDADFGESNHQRIHQLESKKWKRAISNVN